MNTIDAMKQALEALDTCCPSITRLAAYTEAKDNLRTAIAELEKVEPVAWVKLNDESDFTFQKPVHEEGYQKLYAASIESKHWEITAKQLGKQLDECERERKEYKRRREELLRCDGYIFTVEKLHDGQMWRGQYLLPDSIVEGFIAQDKMIENIVRDFLEKAGRSVALAKVGAGKTGEGS